MSWLLFMIHQHLLLIMEQIVLAVIIIMVENVYLAVVAGSVVAPVVTLVLEINVYHVVVPMIQTVPAVNIVTVVNVYHVVVPVIQTVPAVNIVTVGSVSLVATVDTTIMVKNVYLAVIVGLVVAPVVTRVLEMVKCV